MPESRAMTANAGRTLVKARNSTDRQRHCCFVIKAFEPYCFELLQLFSLPSGFLYRQRYDERWTDEHLRGDIAQLMGKEVLVLFWDHVTKKLYPIRWGTITT